MKNKRAGRILSLFLASQILLAGTVLASPLGKAEQEKRSSEKNLNEVRQEIEELEKQKETVLSEITEMDEKISDLLIVIHVLEDEIGEKKKEIDQTEIEYRQAQEKEQNQYDAMKKRIQYVYEKGDTSYLEIILESKSLSDAICESEYFKQLYEYDREMFLDYKEVKEQVEALEQKYKKEEAEMEVMESEYLAEKEALERSVALKRLEAADFDERLQDANQKAELYAKAVKEQTEKLRQLREVKRRQLEAARENRQEANRSSGNTGNYGPGQQNQSSNQQNRTSSGTPIKSTGGSEKGREIADYALQFVGNPYVWGGTSLTNGADCSGYVQSVYKHFGISIPRTSAEQSKFGKRVAFEDLQPGDLVFYAGHVVMSIGDGRIVHASSAKDGIKVSDDVTYRTILDIRRPWES